MICKWLADCAEGAWALLIALTLPVTHKNINHNYDKITQTNVSEESVSATDAESDHDAVCNNWHVCVC